MAVVSMFLLAVLVATGAEGVLEETRTLDQAKPIGKVIKLMKDMLQELDSDQAADEKIYEEMSCWCKNGEKEKTKEIAEGEMTAKTLASSIEELTAKQQQLKETITSATEALAKNKEALADATGIRDKELAEFNKADKEAIQAIGGLKSAVQVLSKHQDAAAAALPQEALLQLRESLHSSSHHFRAGWPLHHAPGGRARGLSLLQQPVSALQQAYASGNSNEIFGVLQSMKESFEANQATARKEEASAAAEFASMSKAKKDEIAGNAKIKSEKNIELGSTAEALENAKMESKDTSDQLDENRKFLSKLQAQCSKIDAEWEIRQKMRQDETTAVAEALEILTDDSARDLAAKTTSSVSLLQTTASNHRSNARMHAARLLAATGKRLGRPLLSLVATELQSDVFGKIKESIDEMVVTLKQQAKDEVKQKDWCTEKLNDNERGTAAAYDQKARLETKRSDLEATIAKLADELKVANTEFVDTQLEMHTATENRKMESKEYTQTISDQRAMGEILTKALARLKEFYSKKRALLQVSRGGQEPPVGFKAYEDKSPAAGGVVGMLKEIVKETHETQKHAIFDNMQSQMAYEEFMREANKSIHMLQKTINDKTEEKAQADADAERVDADLRQKVDDLEALDAVKHELQGTCGFLLDNFDHRVEARTQEIDALNEAKNTMN